MYKSSALRDTYTLSLHDALPISSPHFAAIGRIARKPWKWRTRRDWGNEPRAALRRAALRRAERRPSRFLHRQTIEFNRMVNVEDRKSTRLNSSHANSSYAFFFLK